MVKLTEFAIRNLYGYRDITIPIRDNKIVLVGVNGLGKTTIINLLYFFLSRQWRRISEYEFSEISLKIEGEQIVISLKDVESVQIVNQNLFRNEALRLMKPAPVLPIDDALEANSNLRQVEEYLKEHIDVQILYLPTYRRIEKELEIIFPALDEYVSRYHENIRIKPHRRGTEFVKLIEFGMRDVEQKISDALSIIKDNARTELNNLAGSYLRDVIRREANAFDQISKNLMMRR